MKTPFRIGLVAIAVLAVTPLTMAGANRHSSGVTARITMRDGTVRTARLEGVGCAKAICSRTAIAARTKTNADVKEWFDNLAVIQDTTAQDALFVSKDGTSRRLSLLNDFRVLYLANRLGGTEKLDLAEIRMIEFRVAEP